MNLDQARKLKNGQHIQVKNRGKWIDALFIENYPYYEAIYAHYMGYDEILKRKTSIYGSNDYFDYNDVRLPIGGNSNEVESISAL